MTQNTRVVDVRWMERLYAKGKDDVMFRMDGLLQTHTVGAILPVKFTARDGFVDGNTHSNRVKVKRDVYKRVLAAVAAIEDSLRLFRRLFVVYI